MAEIIFKSEMTVELMKSQATDASVVEAARVSTQGEASRGALSDAGLINYLMRDRHGTPFEHNSFTWFVSAPIVVIREFQRHRIASYNEESGRYKELEPVFYVPREGRPLVQEGKPGAYRFTEGTEEQYGLTASSFFWTVDHAWSSYRKMLDAGIAREVARMVLPLNIYSSMYVTMNARALMNFLSLRSSDQGQFPSFPMYEIAEVARLMEESFAAEMPITYEKFVANGRVAP